MEVFDQVNQALIFIQAVRQVARACVYRQPDATYIELFPPLSDDNIVKQVKKAVREELNLITGDVTNELLINVCLEVVNNQDFSKLVRYAIDSYVSGIKEFTLTSNLLYHTVREVEIPINLQDRKFVIIQGQDHLYKSPKGKKAFKQITEDGEIWIKYANYINLYGYLVPEYLIDSHCAQTCNLHTCMSVCRSHNCRFLREIRRTALELIQKQLDYIDLYHGYANKDGDILRTKMSLKYTFEIISRDEPDWLRAWTNNRFGINTHLARFDNCFKCPYTRKLPSKGNLFLSDLQAILDEERGNLKPCPECHERSIQEVNITMKNGIAVDLVRNESQYGPLLRYMDRFLPRQIPLNGSQEDLYHLHTLQMVEWYGPLREDIDSHAFVVQVRGDELIEVCDSDPLTWPNKVITEADLRTRNMRVQVAIFLKLGENNFVEV